MVIEAQMRSEWGHVSEIETLRKAVKLYEVCWIHATVLL